MSKKYYYIRRQENGCDYTIGCGVSIQLIRADSREEAIKKIIDLPDNWKQELKDWISEDGDIDGCYHDTIADTALGDITDRDNPITSADLIEVSDEIDMMPILEEKLAEAEAFKKELLDAQKEKAELEQYEKLKKKFGKQGK